MSGPPDRLLASFRVAAGILGSRLTGLIREGVFAHFFGASAVADAWRAALRMPNVLQNLLGEGALSASFIPIYSELLEQKREAEAARFAGAILGLLTLVVGVMAFLGVLLAPFLTSVLLRGFDPDRQATTVALVRILFPMTALLVLSAWALGVLNSHRRFFLSYVAPVAWNGAMIAAMGAGALGWGLSGDALVRVLAWGAFAGGAFQLAVQLPTTLRLLGEFRPSLSLERFGVREAIRNFIPMVAARGAVNLSGYLDHFLASFLALGALAVLGYAQILYLLPISLFGMAVAASELPELSRERRGGGAALAQGIREGLQRSAYFVVPSTVAYLLLGGVIVSALFERGAFGGEAVTVTWAVLAAYSLGLPASTSSRVLSSAFFALRDTRTPARVAYLRVSLSLAVGLSLMLPLDRVRVGDLSLGAAGLALGATAGAWLERGLLGRRLRATIGAGGMPRSGTARLWLAAALAGAAGMGGSLLLIDRHPWVVAAGTLLPFAGVYLGATTFLGVADPVRSLLPRHRRGP